MGRSPGGISDHSALVLPFIKNIPNSGGLKSRMLSLAAGFPYAICLDSCEVQDRFGQYEWVIAFAGNEAKTWTHFEEISQSAASWKFGVLSYELKNQLEPVLHSGRKETIPFPEIAFFEPETILFRLRGAQEIQIFGKWKSSWESFEPNQQEQAVESFSGFESQFTRKDYCETIETLREHIRQGDCYEINLTQEFLATAKIPRPELIFEQLTSISPVPSAAFFRFDDIYLICASPERFLCLEGDRLLTQPIKGTRPRGNSPESDLALKEELAHSEKEQAENVMIVDLSRNDLYRSSEINSVSVPHLFEVQTFPQVHHLVSTIVGTKRPTLTEWDVLRNTFPPGSMTGAPKVAACQLIEQYERTARGIYAGSVGYFSPGGDFDLNVVIRSLIYDAAQEKLSYHVGGAITFDSDADAEYEETLVKARAISQLFSRF